MRVLNLLPWRTWQEQQRKKHFLFALLALSTIILSFTLFTHGQLRNKIIQQQSQLQQLQQLQQTNEQQQHHALQTQQKLQTTAQQLHELQVLNAQRHFLLHLLNLFANQLPSGMYLTAVKQQDDIVQIDGYAATHQAVTQLVTLLNSTPEFYFAQLQFIKEVSENNQLSFAIQINRAEDAEHGTRIE